MDRIRTVLARLTVLAIVISLFGLTVYSAAAAERAESVKTTANVGANVLVRGTLLSTECLLGGKDKGCPLWGYRYDRLVLLSDKRTLYRINLAALPRWKADKGFGKKVVITGERRGQGIVVRDLVPLEGGGKISKACL